MKYEDFIEKVIKMPYTMGITVYYYNKIIDEIKNENRAKNSR